MTCFENAASQGHQDSICEMGEIYENGIKDDKNEWVI